MVHVHIYKVIRKAELDVPVTDVKEAMKLALENAKKGELIFGLSDCEFLAEGFDEGGQGHING